MRDNASVAAVICFAMLSLTIIICATINHYTTSECSRLEAHIQITRSIENMTTHGVTTRDMKRFQKTLNETKILLQQ